MCYIKSLVKLENGKKKMGPLVLKLELKIAKLTEHRGLHFVTSKVSKKILLLSLEYSEYETVMSIRL